MAACISLGPLRNRHQAGSHLQGFDSGNACVKGNRELEKAGGGIKLDASLTLSAGGVGEKVLF